MRDETTILQTPRTTRGDGSTRNTCLAEIKQGEVRRGESSEDGVTRQHCFNQSPPKKVLTITTDVRNSGLYNSENPRSVAVMEVESKSHGVVTGAIVIVFDGG